MDNALILSHLDAGVLTLTLNRPDRLNSFNDEMHRQLSEALTQAERDDSVRCLLIAGAGRGFCAGQDLNDRVLAGVLFHGEDLRGHCQDGAKDDTQYRQDDRG